jgi:hypothetical protein
MLTKRIGLLALALLSALTAVAAAEADPPPAAPGGKMYTNKQQFRLPFNMSDGDRAKLREVQLYVKSDTKGWACQETAPPTQTHFSFHAPQDGEYWFNIVTVDKSGHATPADVSREAPALIVVVDSQQPEINVTLPTSPGHGGPDDCIRCSVRDANPDPSTLKVEAQAPDKSWHTLEAVPGNPESFHCPETAAWNGMVRVTATDRAGNTTVREIGSPASPAAAGTGAVSSPAESAAGRTESRSEKLGEPEAFASGHLVTPSVPPAANGPALSPAPTGPALPAVPTAPAVPPPAGSHDPIPTNRQIVNNPTVSLDYRVDHVGPSGVGKVEVWLSSDEGHNWQKLCEDPDKRSPVEFRLPAEGVYGVCLVVTNGLGVGDPPPANGTAPEFWIELDTTKPAAQLLSARPGMNEDAGTIFITWTASDKNLSAEPIDLYYAQQKEGPWQPIAHGLRNDGAYRWRVPAEAGNQFYIRLMVTDRANNTAICDTPQPVLLDMSKPKGVVIGLSGAPSKSYSPTGN